MATAEPKKWITDRHGRRRSAHWQGWWAALGASIVFQWLTVALALATIVLFLFLPSKPPCGRRVAVFLQGLYALWTVAPPTYLMNEYANSIWWYEGDDLKKWERMQDLTKAFWGALLIVLALIFFGRFDTKLFGGI